jgi:small-conductance mechanosensitive channel
VIALLQATALNHPDVLAEPPPSVFLLEYGNNVASFQLNIWLENPLLIPTAKSELKVQLWQALADHGIALPFPEMELHFPPQGAQPLQTNKKRQIEPHLDNIELDNNKNSPKGSNEAYRLNKQEVGKNGI